MKNGRLASRPFLIYLDFLFALTIHGFAGRRVYVLTMPL